MDILSVIGLILGLTAIIGGNLLEGGYTESLMQLTAFVIVMGGTTGAVMLQTPLPVFMRSLRMLVWVFFPPREDGGALIERIVEWSSIARKEGLLGLETIAEVETDEYSTKGLTLLVDGSEPETMRKILEVDLDTMEHFDLQAARVYEGMGGYSPTIGIIGAVMGLIHVMNNLADPSKLGSGIAVAFVATIYGVGLANLVFLPVASKLKSIIHDRSQYREMMIEGLISIAQGENPRNIETKLKGFLI
ncbi:MAG: flagellar motor protein [Gammaproteobacteria bacterium]|nr:MAG: flagellar motor protein [Gammaproteobacteria bacterium]